LTYFGNIISKDAGCSEDIQNRITKAQGCIFAVQKVWKNLKKIIRLRYLKPQWWQLSSISISLGRSLDESENNSTKQD
jgi:hypothetical protein